MEIIDVVDEKDTVIKTIEKKERLDSEITRSAVIMLSNSKNEILLQLRAAHDSKFPSHWDISAGGGVQHGESYQEAATRELAEEIGVKAELTFISKYLFNSEDGRKYFGSFFKGNYEGEFIVDEKEVDKVKYFSIEKIKRMIEDKEKFHPECLFILKKYFLEE